MKRHWLKNAIWTTGRALAEAAFWVAPEFVGKRICIRNALELQRVLLRRNEGAESGRFPSHNWLISRLSANAALDEDLEDLQERSDALSRNDPLVAGYVRGKVTNVVGVGFLPQARVQEDEDLGIDQVRARRINKQLESVYWRWYPKAHRGGRKSFWLLMRLAERYVARDGEALVVFSSKEIAGKPIPLVLEVVALERLSTPPKESANPLVRMGVKFDGDGTPISYFIRTTHPYDNRSFEYKWDEVPADRVCHIYEEDEADQSRGLPGTRPVIALSKDCKDYDEASLIGKQIHACLAAFVTTQAGAGSAIGAASGLNSANKRLQDFSPGTVSYLNEGEDVTFSNPGGGGNDETYMAGQHHKMAAGLGYPYEMLCKRWGESNYSSGRMALLDGRQEFSSDQQLLLEMLADPVWERLVFEAVLAGEVNVSITEFLLAPWIFLAHAWIPPAQPWVDPLKEVLSSAEAVDNKFTTRSAVLQTLGADDEEVQGQWLRERMLDADNEKKLRDYRIGLGLPPEPAQAAPKAPAAAEEPPDEEKTPPPTDRALRILLATKNGD